MSNVTRISDWLNRHSEEDEVCESPKPIVSEEAKNKAIRELTKAVRFHFHKGKKLEVTNKTLLDEVRVKNTCITEFASTLHLYEIMLDEQDRNALQRKVFAI